MLKHLLSNQSGFFAMLLVALTSFALWSTMSTMHMYSTNKSDTLAKIKETVDMNAVMSDFAIEAQDAFYRHYIENNGDISGSNCPDSYHDCQLGTRDMLCLKDCPDGTDCNTDCSTCLEVVYGKNSIGEDVSEEYCATFSDFSSDDAFGDCSNDKVLCVTVAIDADKKDKAPDDLADCKSCFVQPLKIYLDIETPPCTNPNQCDGDCNECINGRCNGGKTCGEKKVGPCDTCGINDINIASCTTAIKPTPVTCASCATKTCTVDTDCDPQYCGAKCINGCCDGAQECTGHYRRCSAIRTCETLQIGCDRDSDCARTSGGSFPCPNKCNQGSGNCTLKYPCIDKTLGDKCYKCNDSTSCTEILD